MAFGQSAGPPATAKQLATLLELLQAAGHSDFRDARGPMGFNQRQAGGRFTRDEADAFVAQLEQEAEATDGESLTTGPDAPPEAIAPRPLRAATPAQDVTARNLPTDVLAAELQRRGWIVVEP